MQKAGYKEQNLKNKKSGCACQHYQSPLAFLTLDSCLLALDSWLLLLGSCFSALETLK